MDAERTQSLTCVECEAESTDGFGWRAHLTFDEDESVEVVILCDRCAAREFDRP